MKMLGKAGGVGKDKSVVGFIIVKSLAGSLGFHSALAFVFEESIV